MVPDPGQTHADKMELNVLFFPFGGHIQQCSGLTMALHQAGVTLDGLRKPYGIPGLKPRPATSKTNAPTSVLSPGTHRIIFEFPSLFTVFCHVWLFVYLDKCSFPTTSPALYVGGDVLMIILSGLVAGSTALKLSALREECSLSFVFCVLNSRRNQACLIQILLLFSGKPPGEALDDE